MPGIVLNFDGAVVPAGVVRVVVPLFGVVVEPSVDCPSLSSPLHAAAATTIVKTTMSER
jgi:hypothetical protein